MKNKNRTITTNVTTNNKNNTNKKEETTMTTNTTKKTTSRIRRTAASMLAAVMVMTTAATIAASASTDTVKNMNVRSAAASTGFTDDTKVTVNKDQKMIIDMTSKTLFTVLNECTPYGKFVTPVLETFLGSIIDTPEDPTQQKLDDINAKLDKLFDKIDESEKSLKDFFSDALGAQAFYNDLINFKVDAERINSTIQSAMKDKDLTNAQKLAKIAEMVGRKTQWDVKFDQHLRVLNNKFKKPSATKSGDIFEIIYNHYCQDVMFSGEALDRAKPVFDFIIQTYTASCTTIIEGLAAQRYIATKLTDEEKASIKDHMGDICTDVKDIDEEIKTVSEYLTGKVKDKVVTGYRRVDNDEWVSDEAFIFESQEGGKKVYYAKLSNRMFGLDQVYPDKKIVTDGMVDSSATVKTMYWKIMNKSREIVVDKGHTSVALSYKLRHHDQTNDSWADGKYANNIGKHAAENFNDYIGATNILSGETVRSLAKYAADHEMTVRQLLDANGFNTTYLPENTNLVTEKAWGKDEKNFWDQKYSKAWYKGINIDELGATEKTIKFMDAGYDIWRDVTNEVIKSLTIVENNITTCEWTNMTEGYACALEKK